MTCKGMKVAQLRDWLLTHEDVGDDYKEDIQKLADAKYNGNLFLKLNQQKLDGLGVSPGFRDLVLETVIPAIAEVQKLDETTSTPVMKKAQPPENNFFFCMTGYKNLPVKTQAAPQQTSQGAAAWIPLLDDGKPAVWSNYKELRVRFMYDQDFNPVNYDPSKIIEWANEWNQHGRLEAIPQFRLARDGEKAEIRVKLNDKQSRWSWIGREADKITDENEATMELDIHNGLPAGMQEALRYMKFLVMHEFGHALGLGHEHQRSDFWGIIIDFINIEEMKTSIRRTFGEISNERFEQYFAQNWSASTALVADQTKYDRESVMHYWFFSQWFDWNKYDSRRNALKPEVVTTLDAIRYYGGIQLADHPSQVDIDCLTEYYGGAGGKKIGAGPPVPDSSEQETILTDGHIPDLMKKLGDYSSHWNEIGLALRFSAAELKTITDNITLLTGSPQSWMKAMLTMWVRWPTEKHRTKPTLSSLCKALRSGLVGLGALANKVEKSGFEIIVG